MQKKYVGFPAAFDANSGVISLFPFLVRFVPYTHHLFMRTPLYLVMDLGYQDWEKNGPIFYLTLVPITRYNGMRINKWWVYGMKRTKTGKSEITPISGNSDIPDNHH